MLSWLTSAVGVTRSVAPGELATLRRLGWVDDQSVTEQGWALRGDHGAGAASETLQRCYPDLLQVVDRQPDTPADALRAWLRTNSELGETAISRVVRTFLGLRELAQTGVIAPAVVRTTRASKPRTPEQGHVGGGRRILPDANASHAQDDVRTELAHLRSMIEASQGRPHSGSLTPAVQEITFPLREGGVVRIMAPRSLRQDDVKRLHALVDLLVVEDNA